jgi:hypothetical protein
MKTTELFIEQVRIDELRKWYEERIGGYDVEQRRSARGWRFPFENEPLVIVGIMIALAAGVVAGLRTPVVAGIIVGTGVAAGCIVAMLLFGWAWWRIHATLFTFLNTFNRVKQQRQ